MDIEDIFAHAVGQHDLGARAGLVEQLCAGDEAKRTRVLRLLAAHDAAGDFLARPAAPAVAEEEPLTPAASRVGQTFGAYTLTELLGEGAFGAVYAAQQEQPVRREVAVKLLRPGTESQRMLRRFEAEKHVLARMAHPGIARVLDAGTDDDGSPWFAMDLVRGVPITEWCDRGGLDAEERIGLFVELCEAVSHAHARGIVHRDLKPANVLVTERDGRAYPVVIDFGIAKLPAGALDDAVVTQLHEFLGTPEYVSPEQAEARPDGIDARSDIYSLGVLLYELLTGSTPISRRQLSRAALSEVAEILRREQTELPSARVSREDAGTRAALAARGTDARGLERRLRGELDWIVLKALAKEPGGRYGSADAFASDLRAHLAHEPVSAGAPSRVHRARRWIARRRVSVSVVGLFLAVIVLAVLAVMLSVRQATLAREAERQARMAQEHAYRAEIMAARNAIENAESRDVSSATAEAERRDAEARHEFERERQRALQAFLTELLGLTTAPAGAHEVSANDVLDRAAEALAGEDDVPLDVALRLSVSVAMARVDLDDLDGAEELLRSGIERMDEAAVGDVPLQTARQLRHALSTVLRGQGREEEAAEQQAMLQAYQAYEAQLQHMGVEHDATDALLLDHREFLRQATEARDLGDSFRQALRGDAGATDAFREDLLRNAAAMQRVAWGRDALAAGDPARALSQLESLGEDDLQVLWPATRADVHRTRGLALDGLGRSAESAEQLLKADVFQRIQNGEQPDPDPR